MSYFLQTKMQDVIEQFLTKTAICAPSIIITKPKFHFLVHLPYYIRHFGPALLFATERYESFNTVFRLTCIYSNRRAPSRDSALTFAQLDRVKHIASGGWWYDNKRRRYACAAPSVLNAILWRSEYAHLIGLSTKTQKAPGVQFGTYFTST